MPESPLTPAYDPAPVEAKWYGYWERHGFFRPRADQGARPYTIVIPPPNITGSLHLGHALNNTLQDVLIRWRRMRGDAALWIPGTDHAGIATQNVVERQLKAEKKTREQLGRKAFIDRVWEWRNNSGRTIITQLKRLGASCDWSRERFTMDEGLSAAVREVFVRLHKDGLLYRGERLVNWCPRCQTAISDIEVEHEEVNGKMYYIKYPVADAPDTFLTVATTRPETMLADMAVAVHPDDSRYNKFTGGEKVNLPLTERTIPIVSDSILVDREFGTGAVKITPGHDFNDEKAGQRHGLFKLSLIDRHALMTELALQHVKILPEYQLALRGKTMAQARELVGSWLHERGFLVKTEDHRYAVGKCYRCKTIVEPRFSFQWFVKTNDPKNSLAAPAIDAVRSGRIRLIPEGWANNYFGWMEQIQDWCVSRQIWWGHRIPAWYCKKCIADSPSGPLSDDDLNSSDNIWPRVTTIVQEDRPSVCPACGSKEFVQDPDVLDTWFSSALWPFSTLGWPKQAEDLETFYPTSALVTSFDILFFWVARMIMMGLYVRKEIPFRDVYIHALVRDAEGQKMSKSKGNVIDPLEVMNQYGTDALRFTLASMASPGRDIKLSEERIAGYRNFANKLWNAARFILMKIDNQPNSDPTRAQSAFDQAILSKLNRCVGQVNDSLNSYRFDEAANTLYHFIWHEYCDWYLEFAKLGLADERSKEAAQTRATLAESFELLLRLLHPFMPFITEELWQKLPHEVHSIMIAPYPTMNPTLLNETAEHTYDTIKKVIATIQDVRGVQTIPKKPDVIIRIDDKATEQLLMNYSEQICARARLNTLTVGHKINRPLQLAGGPLTLPGGVIGELIIDLKELGILGKDQARIRKRLQELAAQIERDENTLANAKFLAKAPPHEVEKIKTRHRECQAERTTLEGTE